jgi:hypothetical protein
VARVDIVFIVKTKLVASSVVGRRARGVEV